jgi:two-component system, LytTR family, response regulator
MKKQKKESTNKNIKAIIINKGGLELDKLSNILTKYEEIEVAGIINPIEQSVPNHILRRVPLWKGKSITILNSSDIAYLAAKDGQVSVVTNTESYLSNYSLSNWEQKLKHSFFFRCHKSYLVNMERIKEVTPFFDNTYIIKFEGLKDEVTVSRGYIKDFREILDI